MIKIEDKLYDDLKVYTYSILNSMLYFLNSSYCSLEYLYSHYDINKEVDRKFVSQLFIDFYKKTINSKSLKEIDSILNTRTMMELSFKDFIKGKYYNEVQSWINICENEDVIKGKYIKFSERALLERFVDTTLYTTDYSSSINFLNNKDTIREDGIGLMVATSILYVKTLVKYIFLIVKYSKKISEYDDIYIMYRNLIYNDNFSMTEELALEKVHSIYSKLYINKFDFIMNYAEFGVVLHSFENDLYFGRNNGCNKKIYDFINESIRNNYIIKLSNESVINIIMSYCIQSYDECSEYDDRIFYRINFYEIIKHLILYYSDFINIFEIIEIISLISEFEYNYLLYIERLNIEKERDRLLMGDLYIEKEQDMDNILFEDIKNGEDFELYLVRLYEKLGYKATITTKTRDQGADLVIIKNNKKTVVQAKFYSNPVGNKAVQEVVGAIKYYNADNAIVITNSIFTKSAIELAKSNNVELIDGHSLNILRKTAFGY